MSNTLSEEQSYLYGKPTGQAIFKQLPEHFQVTELLEPNLAEQQGEHQWLWVEKKGANTQYVAEQLAKFAQVPARDVGYAGLKDRHALTQQWFSVQKPGAALLDWDELIHPEFKVKRALLQSRKLKTGSHQGNHFRLRLTAVTDMNELQQRWTQICQSGVPNYFGPQRFGHNGQNLVRAEQWFSGELRRRPSRQQQGLYLSSVRSWLFNEMVAARIRAERLQPEIGDRLQLAGSRSFFRVETVDPELLQRFAEHDVLLTAALAGDEELSGETAIEAFEAELLAAYPSYLGGLRKARVKPARRALQLFLQQPQLTVITDDQVDLSFSLPNGSFATSVLRELTQAQQAEFNVDQQRG